jgi:hypothetical protein
MSLYGVVANGAYASSVNLRKWSGETVEATNVFQQGGTSEDLIRSQIRLNKALQELAFTNDILNQIVLKTLRDLQV